MLYDKGLQNHVASLERDRIRSMWQAPTMDLECMALEPCFAEAIRTCSHAIMHVEGTKKKWLEVVRPSKDQVFQAQFLFLVTGQGYARSLGSLDYKLTSQDGKKRRFVFYVHYVKALAEETTLKAIHEMTVDQAEKIVDQKYSSLPSALRLFCDDSQRPYLQSIAILDSIYEVLSKKELKNLDSSPLDANWRKTPFVPTGQKPEAFFDQIEREVGCCNIRTKIRSESVSHKTVQG